MPTYRLSGISMPTTSLGAWRYARPKAPPPRWREKRGGVGVAGAWVGLMLVGLTASVPLHAQGTPAPTVGASAGTPSAAALPTASATGQADAVTAMKEDLRRLVSANEVYHVKTKRYAAKPEALTTFRPSAGITVAFITVAANGWSGKATSAQLPGKSCVIYIGTVASPPKTDSESRSAPEAVAVCDKP